MYVIIYFLTRSTYVRTKKKQNQTTFIMCSLNDIVITYVPVKNKLVYNVTDSKTEGH